MTDKKLRIVFMGTPDFSVAPLKALHEAGHDITCVYSQPPRPKGRGHKVHPSPVHDYAQKHDIPVRTPTSLKTIESQTEFADLNADLAVVVAYGLILPEPVLNAPKYGCINIHASLLPRWRGASPIQQAIWADDSETGVTLMFMEKGLDTGPMIEKQSVPISATTTSQSLHDQLSALGAEMITALAEKMAHNPAINSTPQNNDCATYAPLLKKEDGLINWSLPAASIDCQIRALNPWPGVSTHIGDKRIKILNAALSNERHEEKSGTIINRYGHIACGDNTVLKLITIQPHGSKAMDFTSAINGGHVEVGQTFG